MKERAKGNRVARSMSHETAHCPPASVNSVSSCFLNAHFFFFFAFFARLPPLQESAEKPLLKKSEGAVAALALPPLREITLLQGETNNIATRQRRLERNVHHITLMSVSSIAKVECAFLFFFFGKKPAMLGCGNLPDASVLLSRHSSLFLFFFFFKYTIFSTKFKNKGKKRK